jgi:hypothetical protein
VPRLELLLSLKPPYTVLLSCLATCTVKNK